MGTRQPQARRAQAAAPAWPPASEAALTPRGGGLQSPAAPDDSNPHLPQVICDVLVRFTACCARRYLAQLLADDITEYAPVFTEDDELLYPDLGDVGRIWPPPEGDIVQPGAYWLVQYSAGIFSKALLREGFDMTFLNRSRIVLEGGSDDVTLSGIPIVSFTDPNSGLTWLAASYPAVGGEDEVALFDGDGDLVELGSGAAMLRRAEKLARLCTLEEWAPYTDPDDADSVAWQEQLTCETLDDLVADIQLQAEVYGYFNR